MPLPNEKIMGYQGISMPFVKANGVDIYYEIKGTGETYSIHPWKWCVVEILDPQFETFSKKYKMILVDL